jgi:hypothetical protein
MIGLDLDDDAADAVHQQRRANQIGRDLMDAAGKERPLQRPARRLTGRARGASVGGNAALSHSKSGLGEGECVADGNMLKHAGEQAGRLRFPFKRIS